MIDRLTNQEVTIAFDELIPVLGVKEEVDTRGLVNHARKKDIEGCVIGIARCLGLPIKVNISYVPEDYRQEYKDGFQTSSLSGTDDTGHGTESITAQVFIPKDLPMFGTSTLNNFPVAVRVGENCYQHPDTFVAVIAHELSHILLASIGYLKKDNELHTDLVPILLGLRKTVRRGRQIIWVESKGNQEITHTITYGYLPDEQFDFACSYVEKLVNQHTREKKEFQKFTNHVCEKVGKATKNLMDFKVYFKHLDEHPVVKMKKEHADRIVQLHGQDFSQDWDKQIDDIVVVTEKAASLVKDLDHYTKNAIEMLKSHKQALKSASITLDRISGEIVEDRKILEKYVGISCKLGRTFSRHS